MSAALASIVDELHATAAKKLIELINTQKDPSLLARLIATALRFKHTVAKATAAASPSADAGRAGEARPPQAPSPQQRPYDPAASNAQTHDGRSPSAQPLTARELASLSSQPIPTEADRPERQLNQSVVAAQRRPPIAASATRRNAQPAA